MKKIRSLLLSMLILAAVFSAAYADETVNLSDLSSLRNLFGESGLNAFHLNEFSFESIDFDSLLRIVNSSGRNYSDLNFDALLELFSDSEFSAVIGIAGFDQQSLDALLVSPEFKTAVQEVMRKARNGENISESVKTMLADPEIQSLLSSVTGGADLISILDGLNAADRSFAMNKAATALLSPKTAPLSETARLLESFVQESADIMKGKK